MCYIVETQFQVLTGEIRLQRVVKLLTLATGTGRLSLQYMMSERASTPDVNIKVGVRCSQGDTTVDTIPMHISPRTPTAHSMYATVEPLQSGASSWNQVMESDDGFRAHQSGSSSDVYLIGEDACQVYAIEQRSTNLVFLRYVQMKYQRSICLLKMHV